PALRAARWWTRGIAAIVLVAFGGLVTSPAVAAVRAEMERQASQAPRAQSEAEKLNAVFRQVKNQLGILAGKPKAGLAAASVAPATAAARQNARAALKALRGQLQVLDKAAREDFQAVGQHIRKHGLPEVILQRHQAAIAQYEAEAAALLESLAPLETAKEDAAQKLAAKAFKRLSKMKWHESRQQLDPNHLPNRSLKAGEHRKPRKTAEQFIADADKIDLTLALAANESFDLGNLQDAINAAYLAANTEVVLSEAVQAKAAELAHNPVRIYSWVRN